MFLNDLCTFHCQARHDGRSLQLHIRAFIGPQCLQEQVVRSVLCGHPLSNVSSPRTHLRRQVRSHVSTWLWLGGILLYTCASNSESMELDGVV